MELLKMEGSAVVRNKDELILDLKRRIDQLTGETENYRIKGQETFKQLQDGQDVLKRVVRALRIALGTIEGSDDNPQSLKKVD